MGFRRNRILLTNEYLGPMKSCLIGAAIGFASSVAWFAAEDVVEIGEEFGE